MQKTLEILQHRVYQIFFIATNYTIYSNNLIVAATNQW